MGDRFIHSSYSKSIQILLERLKIWGIGVGWCRGSLAVFGGGQWWWWVMVGFVPGHGIKLTSSLKMGDSTVQIGCMFSTIYYAIALSSCLWLTFPWLKSSHCCLGGVAWFTSNMSTLFLMASSKQGMRLLQVVQQIRITVIGSRQDLRARTHVTFYEKNVCLWPW